MKGVSNPNNVSPYCSKTQLLANQARLKDVSPVAMPLHVAQGAAACAAWGKDMPSSELCCPCALPSPQFLRYHILNQLVPVERNAFWPAGTKFAEVPTLLGKNMKVRAAGVCAEAVDVGCQHAVALHCEMPLIGTSHRRSAPPCPGPPRSSVS